jgi:nucleotide-binding universal stress UspA family protein
VIVEEAAMAQRVVVGYDGSPAAGDAIAAGTRLVPGAQAWITYLWGPPFASERMRRRLWERAGNLDGLIELVEQEGRYEAERITGMGVTLARAGGWQAEALVQRCFGGEGLGIGQAAESVDADLIIVGSRGLGGTEALLGSVSDMTVHYGSRPVLVIPNPLLSAEYGALGTGPVVVGWDGSEGAQAAIATAQRMFPQRPLVAVSVDEDHDVPTPEISGLAGTEVTQVRVARGRGRAHRVVANALIAAADDNDAAVVVVGSRGRSAAREIVLGSAAMNTLHHSHRPVMVVPNRVG